MTNSDPVQAAERATDAAARYEAIADDFDRQDQPTLAASFRRSAAAYRAAATRALRRIS